MKTRVRRWAPLLLVPVVAMSLAGCSGDDESGDRSGDGAGETAGDTASPSGSPTAITTSPPDLPTPPQVGRAEGAVADVDWDPTTCETSPGTQTVSGTLTNPTTASTGYVVTISWTNATSDVLALGYQVVRGVKPDQEREWELSADVGEGATQCVINVLRGTIKK